MVSPKVFRVHGEGVVALIGYTTDFRFGQLLEHGLALPRIPDGVSLERWLSIDFANALRAALGEGGYTTMKDGREEGGTLMVGVAGRLFMVHDDFGFIEPRCGYGAIGGGYLYAIGSLWTSGEIGGAEPSERVALALRAAENHNGGVMAPHTMAVLPDEVNT